MTDSKTDRTPLTYRDAGVDIDAGNALVDRIKPLVAATQRPEVLAPVGGFGGLFGLDTARYPDPVLVSGTDGVGTKLMLAKRLDRHDTIGIDLVAMCVNDVLVQGAEPLFFLDYFATGQLQQATAARVISGIADGCQQAGCALIGGETAEMPDMYGAGDYDLAGFTVGAVNRDQLITGEQTRAGDTIIGLDSSGPHSNGFSLIRKIIERAEASQPAAMEQTLAGTSVSLAEALMAPTILYVKPVLALLARHSIHAMAHITGGGLTENLLRVVPKNLGVHIDLSTCPWPPVFRWLSETGQVAPEEMRRTFNCGIGYCLIAPPDQASEIISHLDALNLAARVIGEVVATEDTQRVRLSGE